MDIEYDPAKNAANIDKHGVDFETAALIFDGPVLEFEDDRRYGEERTIAYGAVAGLVLAVVYSDRIHRDEDGADLVVRRLISARQATRKESQEWLSSVAR
jgi:uncharacterized DUF497 family protein